MWYLPITDRLKRFKQSKIIAAPMGWHIENEFTGRISHPSDAEASKHFRNVYNEFEAEALNVYIGLCTDRFRPFGKSCWKYSLWLVIVTPYYLPMKQKFICLTIRVHGPAHPRRSLYVFLQPLIEGLKMLWFKGVLTYYVSLKNNFKMQVVLMWTISDFSAYGMLLGCTTHGILSCTYYEDNKYAFQLKHGQKSCCLIVIVGSYLRVTFTGVIKRFFLEIKQSYAWWAHFKLWCSGSTQTVS